MVEQFCDSILQTGTRNSKALANLVMGLSSQRSARSVVEVCLSPCYHYQYSSINKTIAGINKPKGGKSKVIEEDLSPQEVEKNFVN